MNEHLNIAWWVKRWGEIHPAKPAIEREKEGFHRRLRPFPAQEAYICTEIVRKVKTSVL